jgi:pilus assembly protein CpaC
MSRWEMIDRRKTVRRPQVGMPAVWIWAVWVWAMLAVLCAGSAVAQTRLGATPQPAPAAEPVPAATRGQPITLEVGTGILVPLPRPAATVLSAEPNIARVQPASPTSLFLMGASSGHTTIIATSDTGTPIVQYDVTVVGAGGGRPAAPFPAMPDLGAGLGEGPATISQATITSIESAIHRMLPGGTSIHASAAGGRVLLTGSVATPAAAQQAEAIAHGYAGEKTVVLTDFLVLSSIQVNVRVRIAEMNRTIERQLGFNWQAFNTGSTWRFGSLIGAGAAPNSTISGLTTGVSGLSAATVSALPFAAGCRSAWSAVRTRSASATPPAAGTSTASSMRWPPTNSSPSWPNRT